MILAEATENIPINFCGIGINEITLITIMDKCPVCDNSGKPLNNGFDGWECPKCGRQWKFGRQYILAKTIKETT